MTHHGGIVCTFWRNWYERQVLPVQHGVGAHGPRNAITGEPVAGPETLAPEELMRARGDLERDILEHPLDDDYHRARSADWDRIEIPLLSSANWGGQGLHARGNFEGFVRAASSQKWLEVHGLEHWTHFYTDHGRTLQKRFMDHFLKGDQNDWTEQPRVLLQVRNADGTFVERGEDEWPLARTAWTRYHLDARAMSLSPEPVDEQADVAFQALTGEATFVSDPIESETEITGPAAAKLFVSSSTQDADLFVVLRLVSPGGDEVTFQGAIDPRAPVAQGWLRASHRGLDPVLTREYRPYHTHDEIQPLQPGRPYEVDVEIWPTSVVVPAGYRIALTIRGRDYEHEDDGGARIRSFANELRGSGPFLHDDARDRPPEVFGGTTAIHAGASTGSYLLLPVIPNGDSRT